MAEKASVTSVSFGDKKIDFGAKAKVKWARIEDNLVAYFRNGDTRSFNPKTLTAKVQEWLMYHGTKQKLVDKFADADTAADCVSAVDAVWAMLTAGDVFSGTRIQGPRENLVLLARALVAVKAAAGEVHTQEEALAFVTGLAKDARERLSRNKSIIAEIHRIQMAESEDDNNVIEMFGKPKTAIADLPDAPM